MPNNPRSNRHLVTGAALLLALLMVPATARAAPLLVQDFTSVAGLAAAGWAQVNNSSPGGSTGWFQGNPGIFTAQDGSDDYIAANYLNAGAGGAISDWLLLPVLTLKDGDTLSFATRSSGALPDRLEVRFSPNGASTNVGTTPGSIGSFTTLLLTINPSLGNAYPSNWTLFTVTLLGLGGPTEGRLAFRYFVPDTNAYGDYIGIDDVTVTAVPEPAFLTLLSVGVVGLGASRYRWRHR
jgi:hypothetical protein